MERDVEDSICACVGIIIGIIIGFMFGGILNV